ncbi:MAG: hypothetical protein AAB403_18800, partial [Planctomycetota bacterium]
MEYDGRYNAFDLGRIGTYPLRTRANKVTLDDLVRPSDLDHLGIDLPERTCKDIETVAEAIAVSRRAGRP